MAVAEQKHGSSDGKLWSLFRIPFWQTSGWVGSGGTPLSSSLVHHQVNHYGQASHLGGTVAHHRGSGNGSLSSVARALLPVRRRLRLDPANKLYFPYEPGKQARRAIRIKNTSKSHIAFKFQTTAPKSCFMRPPGAILSPGERVLLPLFSSLLSIRRMMRSYNRNAR